MNFSYMWKGFLRFLGFLFIAGIFFLGIINVVKTYSKYVDHSKGDLSFDKFYVIGTLISLVAATIAGLMIKDRFNRFFIPIIIFVFSPLGLRISMVLIPLAVIGLAIHNQFKGKWIRHRTHG